MANPQTSSAAHSKQLLVMHTAWPAMQTNFAMHDVLCFASHTQAALVATTSFLLSPYHLVPLCRLWVQVYVSLACVATSTLVCEPLCSAIDMLLIPHLPQSFAALASLFSALPQLVRFLQFSELCVAKLIAFRRYVLAIQGISLHMPRNACICLLHTVNHTSKLFQAPQLRPDCHSRTTCVSLC